MAAEALAKTITRNKDASHYALTERKERFRTTGKDKFCPISKVLVKADSRTRNLTKNLLQRIPSP